MSTENINLDILLEKIREDAISGDHDAIVELHRRYPALSEREVHEIHTMFVDALQPTNQDLVSLVATAPPSFSLKALTTKVVVEGMLDRAQKNILITGYSLSEYFSDMIDRIIQKSQTGVFVKFFVNRLDHQSYFDKLCKYKGSFLKIYNYLSSEDKMSALHAKVISIDGNETLITSANLSYHGQEGNIELGSRISSAEIAHQVDDIFTQLIFKKVFIEV